MSLCLEELPSLNPGPLPVLYVGSKPFATASMVWQGMADTKALQQIDILKEIETIPLIIPIVILFMYYFLPSWPSRPCWFQAGSTCTTHCAGHQASLQWADVCKDKAIGMQSIQ